MSLLVQPDLYAQVAEFHARFGLPYADGEHPPGPLSAEDVYFRIGFMAEELAEFARSQGAKVLAEALDDVVKTAREFGPDLADAPEQPPLAGMADGADALVDLVYVALGTSHLMRLPFDKHWAVVQQANMTKVRATGAMDSRSKRKHQLDVVKPEGWTAPDHWPILYTAALDASIWHGRVNTRYQDSSFIAAIPPAQVFAKTTYCDCGANQGTVHAIGSVGCLNEKR